MFGEGLVMILLLLVGDSPKGGHQPGRGNIFARRLEL